MPQGRGPGRLTGLCPPFLEHVVTRILPGLRDGLHSFDREQGDLRPRLPGVQPMALAMDPASPGRVFYATYNRGLWRSEDHGTTWVPAGTPGTYHEPLVPGAIEERATTFVSVDPRRETHGQPVVWVGTEPARLYRSDDAGRTFASVTDWADLPSRKGWSFPPRPGTCHVRWLSHGSQGELHVSIEYGAVLRSDDAGRTFADRLPGSPLDAHVLLTHPAAPGRLYAALGDGSMARGRSWASSDDGGASWAYGSRGLEMMPYLYGLAINPANPDDVRIAASPDPMTAHRTGPSSIFRDVQGRWVEDADGYPREGSLVPVLAADPASPGWWLALSNLGLFETRGDQGWVHLTGRPDWRDQHPMCLAILAEPPERPGSP